ncbi:MAG: TatD family hydrolase [Coriobacteriales bacterium]|nr:TatD family hydrolase [Coriobacteriales bacterium]
MREVLPADGMLFHAKKGKPIELSTPLAPLADTHGHLTSFRKHDPAAAIARAALAGVRLLVVPVDPDDDVTDASAFEHWFEQVRTDAARLLENCAQQGILPPAFVGWEGAPALVDNVWFVAGVHPYGAQRLLDDTAIAERMRVLLAGERCVGVGEFGIDYGPWNDVDPSAQMQAMRMQLRMAHELGMPVELHIRDANNDEQAQAHQDALRVLREEGVPQSGCDLHCYTCGPQVMEPFVELGCHVAFGGAVTFVRSDDIRDAAVACPEHLLLSETDSPYMAPVPLRGTECEPAMVVFSAACVARVREEAGVDTARHTYAALWRNACTFFGLS